MKSVKFTLPVGALLGGVRHLGGGVFVGDFPTSDACPTRCCPLVFEGLTASMSDSFCDAVRLEPCDDPLKQSGTAYRRVAFAELAINGEAVGEQEFIAHLAQQ